jgi:hypothetical protein
MQKARLFGLECGIGTLNIAIELRRPADCRAALGVVVIGPFARIRSISCDDNHLSSLLISFEALVDSIGFTGD